MHIALEARGGEACDGPEFVPSLGPHREVSLCCGRLHYASQAKLLKALCFLQLALDMLVPGHGEPGRPGLSL